MDVFVVPHVSTLAQDATFPVWTALCLTGLCTWRVPGPSKTRFPNS
uniref:Uncharacterized protein n=1 Tax=Anguilla anguilla TaxID=7936 RepID=A0A0E9WG38_ANGAN